MIHYMGLLYKYDNIEFIYSLQYPIRILQHIKYRTLVCTSV